jgi:VanZ family protein
MGRMRRYFQQTPVLPALLFGWLVFVLLITLLPDRLPIIHGLRMVIGGTRLSDAIGHAGLFGVFTALCYAALSVKLSPRRALLVALAIALALATATELGQSFTVDRDTSLSDFLANWLGAFMMATGLSMFHLPRK